MIDFLSELTTELRNFTPQVFHEWNESDNVVYPYMTFSIDGEYLSRQRDGFTVDIDIFDSGSSYKNIFELEERIKKELCFKRILTDDLFVMFDYQRSNTIPTGDKTIKRRNITLYAQVDWRK